MTLHLLLLVAQYSAAVTLNSSSVYSFLKRFAELKTDVLKGHSQSIAWEKIQNCVGVAPTQCACASLLHQLRDHVAQSTVRSSVLNSREVKMFSRSRVLNKSLWRQCRVATLQRAFSQSAVGWRALTASGPSVNERPWGARRYR